MCQGTTGMPGQGCEQGIPVGQMLRVHNVEKWRTRPSLSKESIVGPAGMFGAPQDWQHGAEHPNCRGAS